MIGQKVAVRLFCTQRCLHTRRANPTSGNTEKDAAIEEHSPEKKEQISALKVIQRFERLPQNWPLEEQACAMVDRKFLYNYMHPLELRPERGIANIVGFGMLFRRFYRKIQARVYINSLVDTGIFDKGSVCEGTKKAFELVSQNAYKNTLSDLVDRDICDELVVKRFEAAGEQMTDRQRELLNVTEKDIYGIAPGVLPYESGPFQFIRLAKFRDEVYLSYGLICCAFYKKNMLYKAVENLPLLDTTTEDDDIIPMPKEYGYPSPRVVFGYLTFGNKVINLKGRQFNEDVRLLDFQYLIL